MKILLLDVNFSGSSTGKIVEDLALCLRDRGHDVKVCFGRGEEPKETNVVKISSGVEVVTDVALSRITGYVGKFSFLATKKLISILDEFKPDIVHLHELHGYYVNIGAVIDYLKRHSIKTIWTFHCEFMYTGRCGYAYDCDNWKTECHDCPQLSSYPISWFFDFSRSMHREKKKWFKDFEKLTLVTPSAWLAARVQQSFLSDKKLTIIYNGINTEVFSPSDTYNLQEKHSIVNELIILTVAPDLMSARKGGKWAVELAKRFLSMPVRFIFVGVKDVSETFPANVTPLPLIKDQHILAEYYSMADLTFLPSEKETFSMVTAESLACGTPVFGFDSGAPVEVAPEGYGLFFDYGDLEKAEKIVLSVLNGDSLFKSPQECVEFAKSRYSKEAMLNAYLSLYADQE